MCFAIFRKQVQTNNNLAKIFYQHLDVFTYLVASIQRKEKTGPMLTCIYFLQKCINIIQFKQIYIVNSLKILNL